MIKMWKSNQKYPIYSFTIDFEVELFKYVNKQQSSSSAYISKYSSFHHWLSFQLTRVCIMAAHKCGCLQLPAHFSQIPDSVHMVLE